MENSIARLSLIQMNIAWADRDKELGVFFCYLSVKSFVFEFEIFVSKLNCFPIDAKLCFPL
jgi:hypothetical protein